MTEREQQDALDIIKRLLTFVPDNSSAECEARVFLWRHDPVWSQAYEAGVNEPVIRRLPR